MAQSLSMPTAYVRCMAGTCPLKDTCLRSFVYHNPPTADDSTHTRVLPMVNLRHAETKPMTDQCAMYRPMRKVRFAQGMKHLLDHVPHNIYATVRDAVISCFSCRRVYFYCKKGEQLISPEEQEAIAAVFIRHNLTPPPFDSYVETYDWS